MIKVNLVGGNNPSGDENVKIIDIKEGRNTLMVKTLNKFGDYTFPLHIMEPYLLRIQSIMSYGTLIILKP